MAGPHAKMDGGGINVRKNGRNGEPKIIFSQKNPGAVQRSLHPLPRQARAAASASRQRRPQHLPATATAEGRHPLAPAARTVAPAQRRQQPRHPPAMVTATAKGRHPLAAAGSDRLRLPRRLQATVAATWSLSAAAAGRGAPLLEGRAALALGTALEKALGRAQGRALGMAVGRAVARARATEVQGRAWVLAAATAKAPGRALPAGWAPALGWARAATGRAQARATPQEGLGLGWGWGWAWAAAARGRPAAASNR